MQELPALRGLPGTAPKRILVMDDELSLLELMSRMLGSQGYEVEVTTDGKSAVTRYRQALEAGCPFDLVILDLTVPEGMGGYDAFQAMHALNPGVKVIVSTGYSHEPVVLNFRSYGIAGVAPKPYKVRELLGAVETVLRAG